MELVYGFCLYIFIGYLMFQTSTIEETTDSEDLLLKEFKQLELTACLQVKGEKNNEALRYL